jgi:hypothetical protein
MAIEIFGDYLRRRAKIDNLGTIDLPQPRRARSDDDSPAREASPRRKPNKQLKDLVGTKLLRLHCLAPFIDEHSRSRLYRRGTRNDV